MSLRISSASLLLIVAACNSAPEENKVAAAPPDDRIECATGGAADFTRSCAIEKAADGKSMVIRHADGGFRRLDVSPDMAVSTADGATPLAGKPLPDGRLEIAVDGDRYRLPPK
jgi:hypothetical protein